MIVALQACDAVPRRTLSVDEKAADLAWIYSQFQENYAPLEYKEARYSFTFEKLKADYLAASAQTKSNDEFYDLMFHLVAEFRDAHTSAALTNSSLPDRAQVAYLGFTGVREGENLVVTELLPTITPDSHFPITVGDKILKLDGVTLITAIQTEMLKYRDVGNTESNNTLHMNHLFTRVSTANGLPLKTDATLTVLHGDKTFDVTIPWVLKDLYQFKEEQAAAAPKTAQSVLAVDDGAGNLLFRLNLLGFNGLADFPKEIRKTFSDGFRFLDGIAGWTVAVADTSDKTPEERLKAKRTVPDGAVFLSEAKTYPAYVSRESAMGLDGKPAGISRLVGYIYVDSFDPDSGEDVALAEFKATLKAMDTLGVQDVVIDTINNGGGSLVLGMKMAQALSHDKVIMSDLQFRLSDSWLDQFETQSLSGTSDAEKEYSLRILNEMKQDQAAGKRLSRRYSSEVLSPFSFTPNTDITGKFNVVLMVNEMCASMCDIFAGILQDNKMATVVGTRTMGAGGNVVSYDQAPNSHLTLRQTESLMVRKDGSYIENNGVTPDVDVAVTLTTTGKYAAVRSEALKAVFKKTVELPNTPSHY